MAHGLVILPFQHPDMSKQPHDQCEAQYIVKGPTGDVTFCRAREFADQLVAALRGAGLAVTVFEVRRIGEL